MGEKYLVCTDLDRTLLPNGAQEESPGARNLFSWLAQHDDVHIAYSTGRDRKLVLEAIHEYRIPFPEYVIGDVGSSIFSTTGGEWQSWKAWHEKIAPDWHGFRRQDIAAMLEKFSSLQIQEESKQNICKLSYYIYEEPDFQQQLPGMKETLVRKGIRANFIYSVDETKGLGLLDILPVSASKQHALEFVMQSAGYKPENTVFAGDSGNDLPVLCSPIQAVLVANATDEVRAQALKEVQGLHTQDALYLAKGGYLGMNGNYAAGILEGVAHYLPQLDTYLQSWEPEHE